MPILFQRLRAAIDQEAIDSGKPALLLTAVAGNYASAMSAFNFPVTHVYCMYLNILSVDL